MSITRRIHVGQFIIEASNSDVTASNSALDDGTELRVRRARVYHYADQKCEDLAEKLREENPRLSHETVNFFIRGLTE